MTSPFSKGGTRGIYRNRYLLLSLPLFLLFTACQRNADAPNILLVTLDTTRADRLGVMGDEDAHTPNLDALAARGVLFERAYSSVSLTLPSHTTILTGLDPNRHGVHDNTRFTVPPQTETIAERLAARGYDTAAFVSAFVLDSLFGLDQGFAVYDDDIEEEIDPLRFTVPTRRGEQTTDRALKWLSQQRRAPFFLWVHYYDVHLPRHPLPPFDQSKDPYDGELSYVDAQVKRLLDGVNASEGNRKTLIIVVGDHGESLGEHEEQTHGILAYDSTLHVPLIVAGTGFPAATRIDAFARTADVTPTILAAVGESVDTEHMGRPLQQLVDGTPAQETAGYFEDFGPEYSLGWARIGGVRTSRWKYTAEPEPAELYDVLNDPEELTNRAADEPEVVARLSALYESMRAPSVVQETNPVALSPDVEEKLAALGYVSAPRQLERRDAPDPRRFVGAMGWIEAARTLALEGRVAESIEALEIFVTSPIVRPFALQSLAPIYLLVGRTDDAIAAFDQLAELTGSIESRIGLVNALLVAGHAGDALREIDRLKAPAAGSSLRLHLLRARALAQLGREDEAERDAAAVLASDPENDQALAIASAARAARDGTKAEIERLQKLLRASPDSERLIWTRVQLAQLLRLERRDVEAVRLLEELPQPPPEHRAILADRRGQRQPTEGRAALRIRRCRAAGIGAVQPGPDRRLRLPRSHARRARALRRDDRHQRERRHPLRRSRRCSAQIRPKRRSRSRLSPRRRARRIAPGSILQPCPDRNG